MTDIKASFEKTEDGHMTIVAELEDAKITMEFGHGSDAIDILFASMPSVLDHVADAVKDAQERAEAEE